MSMIRPSSIILPWPKMGMQPSAYPSVSTAMEQSCRSKDTIHIISWSSYFGSGDLLEWQLFFGAVVKSACCTVGDRETINDLYQALRWSLEACLTGFHPARNHKGEAWAPGSARQKLAGTPLHPRGYYLGVFQILGDLDELCNTFGLAHFNSKNPCFWCACDCDTSSVPWSDMAPTAKWRRMEVQSEPVMAKPSTTVGWDLLHGLDLGPTLHVAANVLEDLCQLPALGRKAEERVGRVWMRAVEVYKELNIPNRLPGLDLGSFRRPGDYPRLRAKANEAKHFLEVLATVLMEVDATQSAYTRHRAQALTSLVDLYKILDDTSHFLEPAKVREGEALILKFLQSYTWLAHQALQKGELRWQLTIKFHYLAHAASKLRWSNVKHSSTYPGRELRREGG